MEHEELTDKIIGAAISVHRELGPGYLEAIYEQALLVELRERGIAVANQVEFRVRYRGQVVGHHRADIVVDGIILIELKAVRTLEAVHFAQTRSYLRGLGLQHGLLFNFNGAILTIKRVIEREAETTGPCIPGS